METILYIKELEEPKINRKEILRYAGVKGNAQPLDALLDECLAESRGLFTYKVVYSEYPLRLDGDDVSLGFAFCKSERLAKGLASCESMIAFAATVGSHIDRLIKRYAVLSPAKAQMLDAIGTERVESLCDAFCAFIEDEAAKRGCASLSRLSPGYSDIPLSMQKEIFSALDCPRKVGISLGENLLMTPHKSVTAFIGILKKEGP